MAESFPISGNIDPKSFPFLLMDLHRQGATGSLKVEGPAYPKALYYRSGRILFGSSNDPKDQLGAILIENGKITAEQFADVNTKVGPGNPLAKVLAESGFVSQRELAEAARIKVERILSDIIGYTSGGFEFEDGVLPKGAVDLKLATEKLVLASVRRIADRSFVLRHLDGLEGAIRLRAEGDIDDFHADLGDLPGHLDGRRSLKEAARLARMDEFDAAKIACGLLFLGLAERGPGGGESAISADPELDLAATAALAFEDPSPAVSTPAANMDDDDPFFTSVGEPPAFDAGPSPPFPLHDEPPPFPMPDDAEPIGVAAEPESPEPAGFVMTEPGGDDPHTLPRASAFVPPIPGEDPEPGLAAGPNESAGFVGGAELETTALPVMEPPPSFSAERIAAEVPEVGHDPVPPSRPSREDLAALDALLNPATTPRPLEPAKAPNKSGRWEPQFQSMARPRRPPSSQASPVLLISLAAGAIALVAAGSWYYLRQVQGTPIAQAPVSPPSPSPLAPTPLPPPTPAAAPLAATPMPSDAPVALPTAEATPLPVAAPVSPLDNGPVTDARSLMRQGSFGPAAKGFAANVKSATGSPFTIQLLVACSSDTVQKALDQVASDDLYILPVSYQGRSCNRICWGLYPDEAGAEQAVATLPDYFRQNGALPKVVKTTTLLR